MKRRIGTFHEFKEHTLAIAHGDRKFDRSEPKVWVDADRWRQARGEGAIRLAQSRGQAAIG